MNIFFYEMSMNIQYQLTFFEVAQNNLFSRLGRSQGLLYKQPCYKLIKWVGKWTFSSHSFTVPPRPNG